MIQKNFSQLFEFTTAQLATLKKEYEPLKGKTMSMPQIKKMDSMLSRYSKDMLIKLANTDIPFLSTSAKSQLVMKRGMKWSDFKKPLDMSEADELQCEACWDGYKQIGMKDKDGRKVPNCVPESVVKEMFGEGIDLRGSFSDAQLETMKQTWKNKPASALTQGVKQMIMNLDAPTRAALEHAKINHISKFAGSTFEQKESVDPTCKICEGESCECPQGENMEEADLSKSQVKMVHKKADDLSKKDFIKRYGKDGDSVRYATATNIVKKKLGIDEDYTGKQAAKLSYDTWLKKVKGIEKGAHGVKGDEHTKYSKQWKDYQKEETELKEGYENNMVTHLGELGIDVSFRLGKMIVHKSDLQRIKDALKDGIADRGSVIWNHRMPEFKFMGEALEENKSSELINLYQIKNKTPEIEARIAKLEKELKVIKKEEVKEAKEMKEFIRAKGGAVKYDNAKQGWFDKSGKRVYLGKSDTNKLMSKDIQRKIRTGDWITPYDLSKEQTEKGDNMNEATYKDKFNAAMKDFGINSLDDLKSDADKKKFFKHVDGMHTGKDEGAMKRGSNLDTFKPKPKEEKEVKEMKELKTGDDDLKPDALKLNAMVKDPHKSKEDEPKKDMNAMYMKSDVRAPVKNGGGADMAKVKDKPVMQAAMKKINAMYKQEKYLPVKEGSIQDTIAKMKMAETNLVEVNDKSLEKMITDYLKKGGTITKLPPALAKGMKPSDMEKHKIGNKGVIKSMYTRETVREFISTYNQHFLTNYKAEEFFLKLLVVIAKIHLNMVN